MIAKFNSINGNVRIGNQQGGTNLSENIKVLKDEDGRKILIEEKNDADKIYNAAIVDVAGRTIKHADEYFKNKAQLHNLVLPSGIYILKTVSDKGCQSHKIFWNNR